MIDKLVKEIVEEVKGKTVAVYGGGFKPPTSGHFEVVKEALRQNPSIDEFIIYVGAKERDGITQSQSTLIWEIYKRNLPMKVTITPASVAPIRAIYDYAKEHPQEEVLWVIGARQDNEEDFIDISSRTKAISKYPNMELRTIVTPGGVSGTAARNALKVSKDKFKDFLPDELSDDEVQEVFDIVSIKESLNEHASYTDSIDIADKIAQLTNHMLKKGMNIEPLPTMELIDGDSENASDFLGKTAYYDPENKHIVLYTEGRHPKDIVRSYAHEMIHHIQNLEGRLGDITTTNTQEDGDLDKLEQEANLKGTMTFRNWTDSITGNKLAETKFKNVDSHKVLFLEALQELQLSTSNALPIKGDDFKGTFETDNQKYQYEIDKIDVNQYKDLYNVIFNEEDGTNVLPTGNAKDSYIKILSTMYKVISNFIEKHKPQYLGLAALDASGYYPIYLKLSKTNSFPDYSKKEIISVGSGSDKLKVIVFKRKEEVKESIVGQKIVCDNCGWSWNIDDGGDDMFTCHKCGSEDNMPIVENLNEGKYDGLVTKLAGYTLNAWKSDFEDKQKLGKFELEVGPGKELDYPHLDFDYSGEARFILNTSYKTAGYAKPTSAKVKVNFIIPPNGLPKLWSQISIDLRNTIRHEIEHLMQSGPNVKKGKEMESDQEDRDELTSGKKPWWKIWRKKLGTPDYYKLEKEIDANLQGLYLQAKKSKQPLDKVIDNYLEFKLDLPPNEREDIKKLWGKRASKLNIPYNPLNEKKNKDPFGLNAYAAELGKLREDDDKKNYKIYVDMDGVVADFDKRFRDLSGMNPNDYEAKNGKNAFWDFIDVKHKLAFWVGIPPMQDAQRLIDYVSKHDYEMLTAPSIKKESLMGKGLWIRNWAKKGLFPSKPKVNYKPAKNKHHFAAPNHILIDDKQSTIDSWNAAGGIGILHTSAGNTINQLKKIGI